MRSLQDLPIQQKLTRCAILTTGTALLLVGVALVSYELSRSRSLMTREMTGMADIIGATSSAAMVSNDAAAGEKILAALDTDSRITAVRIWTNNEQVFATYRQGTSHQHLIPATPPIDGTFLEMSSLTLIRPIRLHRERIGTLYLRSHLPQLYDRLREGAFILIGVLLLSSVVAVTLSFRLYSVITHPIQHLAQTIKVVTEQNDYSVRASTSGRDELGLLTDGFNAMLARIQARDTALQQTRDQLEERVRLRTQELQRDIAKRVQVEKKLQRYQSQLRDLAAHIESVREEEQAAIAREIHDTLGQMLTGLKIDLSWLAARLPHEAVVLQERIETMRMLLDNLIQSVRRLAALLRPAILDDLGLAAAIEWQAYEFHQRTGIACEFTDTTKEPELDRNLATAVFRILQEALTNVVRHAHATRVTIRLAEDAGRLRLTVADNGRGITDRELTDRRSLGLLGMRERALLLKGEVSIVRRSAGGTTVTLSVPFLDKEGVESISLPIAGAEG